MATALEHMIADYTRALDKDGVDLTIDGEVVRVFLSTVEMNPSEFERTILVQQKITHLAGAMPTKVPGQVVTVDNVQWGVVSHTSTKLAGVLIMHRSMG